MPAHLLAPPLNIACMEAVLATLADRVRAAAAAGTPLRIRGGGTKDFYGEPPQGELLATGGLRGVVSYEPSELVVTVRAGTPLAELEQLLAGSGQSLPFEPPHFGPGATVGGMVAAGLSGPARASVGSVRDYVLGLDLLNGRGEHLVFGGQVMKNVAGYDVSRLMVGALGTLGLITQVSLKVLPVAPAEASLRFELPQERALQQLNAWGGRPLPLNASRWQDGVLWLRLRGAVAAVASACQALGGERVAAAQADADWSACREQALPWFVHGSGRDLWRLSVPQAAPVLALPEGPLVEWHGAQRWVRAEPGHARTVREVAQQAGGHATLFRAADPRADQRMAPLTATLDRIQQDLKRQFDPHGIFNPFRLYPHF